MTYHHQEITCYHYSVRHDPDDFFGQDLIRIALKPDNDALLYGILAYSAYLYSFSTPESPELDLTDFLTYYSRSLNVLQQSVARGTLDSSTLLTVLQLATVEVWSLLSESDHYFVDNFEANCWRLVECYQTSTGSSRDVAKAIQSEIRYETHFEPHSSCLVHAF